MKNNNKKNWITKKLRNQCQLKRDLYLLARNNNNIDLLNYYKRYTKELTKKIREAKKEYYNNMIKQSKNKIATTWNIIKMEVNGSVTYNPQIIANVMNQYFLSVGNNNFINKTKINCKDVIDYLIGAFGNPFPRIQYNNRTRHEVEKIIKSLNASNYCGYDEIPAKIVKISSSYISSP
jgi:phospholipase/lecithinase/hemolysin